MKASILINNYNYEKFIDKAIRSSLDQTFKNVEVIVYDDGSKDTSVVKINKYCDEIVIIANENYSRGHCWNQINSINEAFKKSTGDIIFLMDSDDYFFENKVEKIMAIFKKEEDVICIQHRFQLVDEQDNKLKSEKRPFLSGSNILEGIYFTKRLDFFFTQTSGLCFRRSFLEKVLPIPEDELSMICVDIRLSRYAAFEGKVISLQEKLAAYRIHEKNHSSVLKNKNYYLEYDKQHYDFFNNLSRTYNYPYLNKENNFFSYFKVIILLIKAKMTLIEKKYFLQTWYKSYINK
jgi:glycosyltransferase involved in cell wall biosynthesis